jgi:hypothetical protein
MALLLVILLSSSSSSSDEDIDRTLDSCKFPFENDDSFVLAVARESSLLFENPLGDLRL